MQMPLLHENTTVDAAVWMAIVFAATWLLVKGAVLLARRLARYRWKEWIDAGLNALDGPLLLGFPAMAVLAAVPATRFEQAAIESIRHGATIAVIISVGWLIIAVTMVARRVIEHRYRMEVEDNRAARAVNTKFRLLTRILIFLVVVVTTGAVLTTFPAIRTVGAGLLASAGVAGLVIGLAARPFVENVLASIQIAMTEPINLDDVLIIEGEWGRVEEIGATYVVMRIWDDRRLVIPLTYFLTRPFQNWTRHTADITGVVTVTVDYRTPVDRVRDALAPIIESNPKWDGRFWNVQITDADARGMTLRVLCTAADAPKAWDLRCDVRESLIAWLNSNHPECLPRLRAEIEDTDRDAPSAPVG